MNGPPQNDATNPVPTNPVPTNPVPTNPVQNASKKGAVGNVHNKTKKNNKCNVRDKIGIFNIIGNKLSISKDAIFAYTKSKLLRLIGLQEVSKNNKPDRYTREVNDTINEFVESISDLVSTAKIISADAVDIIENVDNFIKSPQVAKLLENSTTENVENLLEALNVNMETPKMKEQTKRLLQNSAEYAEIALVAMNEPLNIALDEVNRAGVKAASAAASGAIKVATDALGAVPFAGAIIDIGKGLNDASYAALQVMSASSDVATSAADLVEDSKANISESINEVEYKKRMLEENAGDEGYEDKGYGNEGYGNEGYRNTRYGNTRYGGQGLQKYAKKTNSLRELNLKRKEAALINNRAQNSINAFERPFKRQTKRINPTRNRMSRRKYH